MSQNINDHIDELHPALQTQPTRQMRHRKESQLIIGDYRPSNWAGERQNVDENGSVRLATMKDRPMGDKIGKVGTANR